MGLNAATGLAAGKAAVTQGADEATTFPDGSGRAAASVLQRATEHPRAPTPERHHEAPPRKDAAAALVRPWQDAKVRCPSFDQLRDDSLIECVGADEAGTEVGSWFIELVAAHTPDKHGAYAEGRVAGTNAPELVKICKDSAEQRVQILWHFCAGPVGKCPEDRADRMAVHVDQWRRRDPARVREDDSGGGVGGRPVDQRCDRTRASCSERTLGRRRCGPSRSTSG